MILNQSVYSYTFFPPKKSFNLQLSESLAGTAAVEHFAQYLWQHIRFRLVYNFCLLCTCSLLFSHNFYYVRNGEI